jgi:hypothetical protein
VRDKADRPEAAIDWLRSEALCGKGDEVPLKGVHTQSCTSMVNPRGRGNGDSPYGEGRGIPRLCLWNTLKD